MPESPAHGVANVVVLLGACACLFLLEVVLSLSKRFIAQASRGFGPGTLQGVHNNLHKIPSCTELRFSWENGKLSLSFMNIKRFII